MPNIQRLLSPQDFAQGWWLDWAEDPDPAQGGAQARNGLATDMRSQRQRPILNAPSVDGRTDFYALAQTAITVNPNGPEARIRYCSDVDINCDLCDGDGLLLAAVNSAATPSPATAPIQLRFSTPLIAIGTHVAGTGLNVLNKSFAALLWVMLENRNVWETPITVIGRLGTVVTTGAATAPFIAAQAAPGLRIREARLTLATSLGQRFETIVIAPLYGIS